MAQKLTMLVLHELALDYLKILPHWLADDVSGDGTNHEIRQLQSSEVFGLTPQFEFNTWVSHPYAAHSIGVQTPPSIFQLPIQMRPTSFGHDAPRLDRARPPHLFAKQPTKIPNARRYKSAEP